MILFSCSFECMADVSWRKVTRETKFYFIKFSLVFNFFFILTINIFFLWIFFFFLWTKFSIFLCGRNESLRFGFTFGLSDLAYFSFLFNFKWIYWSTFGNLLFYPYHCLYIIAQHWILICIKFLFFGISFHFKFDLNRLHIYYVIKR